MSNSKFEYVKEYETHTILLKGTYILVRIDGKAFTKFCENHGFMKPNDIRCIRLMTASALHVCQTFTEIILSYGQSDEYSFVFKKEAKVYSRREEKILSVMVSTFTSAFNFYWPLYFPEQKLKSLVSFDARVVLYPDEKSLKDYFSWRQVDCHINNLYNTTFWALVNTGLTNTEAHAKLKGTFSKDKHEILFNLGINYNLLEDVYKKGTLIRRFLDPNAPKSKKNKGCLNNQLNELAIESEKENDEKKQSEFDNYLTYDKTLNDENSKFKEQAQESYNNGLKILNCDMIDKTEFWAEVFNSTNQNN